jgi:hypothetical protein
MFPSLTEAVAQGRASAEAAERWADAAWVNRAEAIIRGFLPGRCFLAEDVVIQLAEEGESTSNAKAIGGIIQRLARGHIIEKTGNAMRARTSHGSLKPEWTRLP